MSETPMTDADWLPITMQDVRLVAGEGKLTTADVLRAVNIICQQRWRSIAAKLERPAVNKMASLLSGLRPVRDDAVYVRIAPYAVAKTEEVVPGRVFFDRCSHGHIIGVEIIGGTVEHEPD